MQSLGDGVYWEFPLERLSMRDAEAKVDELFSRFGPSICNGNGYRRGFLVRVYRFPGVPGTGPGRPMLVTVGQLPKSFKNSPA